MPEAPEETGATFEENAAIKALGYARRTGLLCIADDSGLEVDALGGRPGVRSARYAGSRATDAENNALLLSDLEGVSRHLRGARYVSVVSLASPESVIASARGECGGVILDAPRGRGGFGYDPLFISDDLGLTFGEAPPGEKDHVSHRGRAFAALRKALQREELP